MRAHRGDHQDELLEGLLEHPVVDLLQDVHEVGLELLVGGDEHAEPVLVLALEGFRRVDAALVEDGVDRVAEELGDDRRAPLERDVVLRRLSGRHGVGSRDETPNRACVATRPVVPLLHEKRFRNAKPIFCNQNLRASAYGQTVGSLKRAR